MKIVQKQGQPERRRFDCIAAGECFRTDHSEPDQLFMRLEDRTENWAVDLLDGEIVTIPPSRLVIPVDAQLSYQYIPALEEAE